MRAIDDETLAALKEQSALPVGIAAKIESQVLLQLLEERAHNLWLVDKTAEQLGDWLDEYSKLAAEHTELQLTAMRNIEELQARVAKAEEKLMAALGEKASLIERCLWWCIDLVDGRKCR